MSCSERKTGSILKTLLLQNKLSTLGGSDEGELLEGSSLKGFLVALCLVTNVYDRKTKSCLRFLCIFPVSFFSLGFFVDLPTLSDSCVCNLNFR